MKQILSFNVLKPEDWPPLRRMVATVSQHIIGMWCGAPVRSVSTYLAVSANADDVLPTLDMFQICEASFVVIFVWIERIVFE